MELLKKSSVRKFDIPTENWSSGTQTTESWQNV